MDWHSIEGYRLLHRAFPLGFALVRGCRTVGGWTVVAVTRRYVDFYRAEGPGRASGSFRHYFEYDPRRQRPKTTPMDMGEMLPLPDTQDPATWGALMVTLWSLLSGAQTEDRLPAGFALNAPDEYNRPWGLTLGSRQDMTTPEFVPLPVLWGSETQEAEEASSERFEYSTYDPAEALVYALISLRERAK